MSILKKVKKYLAVRNNRLIFVPTLKQNKMTYSDSILQELEQIDSQTQQDVIDLEIIMGLR